MPVKISVNILIVEDSDSDFEVTERAFIKAGMPKENLFRCRDGDEALDFLYKKGTYENDNKVIRPNLILLDLNLPGTDGREVLREMHAQSKHEHYYAMNIIMPFNIYLS